MVITLLIIPGNSLAKHHLTNTEKIKWVDTSHHKFIITSYPVNLVISSIKFGVEIPLGQRKSVKVLASVAKAQYSDVSYDNAFLEWSAEVQYKIYLSRNKKKLNGFYMAPYISYKSLNSNYQEWYDQPSKPYHITAMSFGYCVGYQVIIHSALAIDGFIGAGYNKVKCNLPYTPDMDFIFGYPRGLCFHPAIGIGIAF